MTREIAPALDYLDPELEARIFEASAAERPPCYWAGCDRLAAWRVTNVPCRCAHLDLCTPHRASFERAEAAWRARGDVLKCIDCERSATSEWTPL